ncbi:MAG: DUF421 domain-containing protein, partial [Nitrosomonadales bacterium]|nr:DUF421 domain-containing protein [Nitrosomonadales bacterium]
SQNAMSGEASSIADGVLLVGILVFWNLLLDCISYKFPLVSKFIVSPSMVLVKNGKFYWRNMRREFITKEELMTKLREEGVQKVSQVKEMRLEADGGISVIPMEKK